MDALLKNFEIRMHAMTDVDLLQQVGNLFLREKKIGDAIMLGLKEIKIRKLHLAYGYSSLFEMLVKYFNLSETASYQRINSLKLIDQVPEVEVSILSGEISLTNAAIVQSFFHKSDKVEKTRISQASKIEILNSIKGKTIKQVQRQLASINPVAVFPAQKEVPLTATHTQLQVIVDDETLVLLKKLQQELSHIYPDGNYNDIIKYAAKKILSSFSKHGKTKTNHNTALQLTMDSAIDKDTDADANTELKANHASLTHSKVSSNFNTALSSARLSHKKTNPKCLKHRSGNFNNRSRYIEASVRKKIYQRASGQCEFVGIDKHRCQSRYQLEVDHILSFSHGGENNESNLQLLCKNHNLYKMNLTHNKFYLRK